jgi:uncharacterized protein (UPF0248 family)
MQTIQELINRIHWDSEFSKGRFEIGYFDRLQQRNVRLPFDRIYFNPDNHFFFQFVDQDGIDHNVPLHRIRNVYKNGVRIWHRKKPPG